MKRDAHPPRLPSRLFDWYCTYASVEDLKGDLDELFYLNLERMSPRTARLKYWQQVVSLIFSYAVKKRKRSGAYHPFASNANSFGMLRNYFIIASRTLAKQRFFTIINVLGLSIGMSVSLLLLAMFSFLSTYDNFHSKGDRIYRVLTQTDDHVRNAEYASAPAPLGEKIRADISGIEEVVRINNAFSANAKDENNNEIPLQGYYVDPNFLKVFDFPLLKGNAAALTKPNSMLITEIAAAKMFGDRDPIGKILTMEGLGNFEVAGVLKNIPGNSHMQFEMLTGYSTLEALDKTLSPVTDQPWKVFNGNYTYVLLPENYQLGPIENSLNRIASSIYKDDKDFTASFALQSLNGIVPGPDVRNDIGPEWDYPSLSIFVVLTLLLLVPACLNYATISIARALKRAKEIGLRKVVGGQRSQIFFQFIVETVIITFTALAGAYGIFYIVRPEFLALLVPSSAAALDLSLSTTMVLYFIAFALFVGLIAGAPPAIYFSKLNPVQSLKNSIPIKVFAGVSFRKILITAQFALSLGFIMAVAIILKQYRSSLNYDFGFSQESILDVQLQGVNQQQVRNEFEKLSAVQSVSMSSHIVGASGFSETWVHQEAGSDSLEVYQMSIDNNYLLNLDLIILAGKNFSSEASANTGQVIVNEEFLKSFKLTALDALGKTFQITGENDITVIGVVKNFHYSTLRDPIGNFFFRYDPNQFAFANLKLLSNDMATTFSDLETAWKIPGGELRFESQFFDDEIEDAYSWYFSAVKICGFIGVLAVSISCLGLLGMVVYSAETRTKEIGVRKVMGASSMQLAILLSKGYVKLVLIAAVIAIPVTYFLFDKVLTMMQYYRAEIGLLEIGVSLAITLILGVTTIMSQTLKAARSNPVDTLRRE